MSSCIFVVEKCVCLVILNALPKIFNNGFFGFACPHVVKILKNALKHFMLQKKIQVCTESPLKQTCLKVSKTTKKELITKFSKKKYRFVSHVPKDMFLLFARTPEHI